MPEDLTTDEAEQIIETTVKEARGAFDLEARLKSLPMRTDKITVFTDEVLAEAHSEAEQAVALLEAARQFINEEVDPADDALPDLKKVVAAALVELNKTAITFHLRAVPKIVVKDCRRKSRKDLGLKGQIPADRIEEFGDLFTAHLLAASVTSYVDHESGETVGELTIGAARALGDFLPEAEFTRLDQKLNDVQFKNVISESATAQVDF